MRLEGKVALVTGGTRSIGRGISMALAKEGAKVAMNYVNDDEAAEWTLNKFKQMSWDGVAIKADLAEIDQCREIVRKANEAFGHVDIFVSNAVVGNREFIVETTDEVWEKVINVNLRAAFVIVRELMPGMTERKFGRIVTLSSQLAEVGGSLGHIEKGQGRAPYSASKAGLVALTKGIAHEGAPYITANVVAPSGTRQQIAEERGEKWPPEPNEEDNKRSPGGNILGRRGTPEDIAEAILYLVSDSGCFLTGQTLHVDGGHHLP